ncbi:hypothetical protein LTR95_010450 [Oleoguttula sp. CCFEE 5521]
MLEEEGADDKTAKDDKQEAPSIIFALGHQEPKSAKTLSLGQAFLMGFALSRKEDGRSERKEVERLEHNLYTPLTRQKPNGNKRYYSFIDHVYSFAVVGLEIALGKSFFEPRALDHNAIHSTKRFSGDETSTEELQKYLLDQAKMELPRRTGQKLADLIVGCLKLLTEPDSSNVPPELKENWGRAAMAYVLSVLQAINV